MSEVPVKALASVNSAPQSSFAATRWMVYGLAGLVLALDRFTKVLVERNFSSWDSYTIVPGFFQIIHTQNKGAAFSLFANAQSEWRNFFLVGVSALALVLIATLLWRPGDSRLGGSALVRFGLALVLGGAAGNLYDRIAHGAVTDFLEVYAGSFHWPTFNVADTAITVGAALVLLDLLRSRRAGQRS